MVGKRNGTSYGTGRNKFSKKCAYCGIVVAPYEGFLSKKKGASTYDVHHDLCRPAKVKTITPSSNVDLEDDVLSTLEAKLIQRQLNGEPVVMLPKIIDYIKSLQARILELSK